MQVPFTHTLLLHPPNNLNREAFYRSWDWGSQKFLAWEHWAEIPVSRFRVLLLNSTALVGKLILVSLGRTRLPRDAYNLMHYPVRKCSVPVLKPFQGLLPFFLRAILLLVTIYFFFSCMIFIQPHRTFTLTPRNPCFQVLCTLSCWIYSLLHTRQNLILKSSS